MSEAETILDRHHNLEMLIVETDGPWQRHLIDLLQRTPDVKLIALMTDPDMAIRLHHLKPADIILIDVPKGSSFDLHSLDQLPARPSLIITTDDPEIAAMAFDLGVDDLILKPYDIHRFHQAMAKVSRRVGSNSRETFLEGSNDQRSISVRSGRRSMFVPVDEILWVEAIGNHVSIHLHDRQVQANCTMKNIEAMLRSGEIHPRTQIIHRGTSHSKGPRSIHIVHHPRRDPDRHGLSPDRASILRSRHDRQAMIQVHS